MYAPGHLGELTQIVDFALVDAVIEETGSREKRLRLLPSRVVVCFVLALALFEDCSYRGVRGKLTAGLEGLSLVRPALSSLSRARRRARGGATAAAVRDSGRPRRPSWAGRFVLPGASDRGRRRHAASRAR
ncbi:transposase domain-containing protein [Streptomyces erythrochromogenes]|uniref:transposase domain-containing protein n=1 Tax=Streptomyces erythrochromogenes TaxID=285574 RepID=UPI00369BD161